MRSAKKAGADGGALTDALLGVLLLAEWFIIGLVFIPVLGGM